MPEPIRIGELTACFFFIKTLILPIIETDILQGKVQTRSQTMPNLNTTLNSHPSSSIIIVILWYFRV